MAADYLISLRYYLFFWVESWYISDWWYGWFLIRFIYIVYWLIGCYRGRGCIELEFLVFLDNVFLILIGLNFVLLGLFDLVGVLFFGLGVEGFFDFCNDVYNVFFSFRFFF